MCTRIKTPEGYTTVLGEEDMVDLVRKYISADAADYLAKIFGLFVEIASENAEKEDAELRSYELSLESYRDTMLEVSELLEHVLKVYVDFPKCRKSTLMRDVDRAYKKLIDEL